MPIIPWGPWMGGAAGVARGVGSALSLLGSVGSLFKQGGDNSDYNKHRIVKTVRDAKEAGIHPLYAMGAAGAYSPGLGIGPDYGAAASAMGRTLQEMAPSERAKAVVDDGGLRAAQIRSLNASADRDDAAAAASRTSSILQLLGANSNGLTRGGTMLNGFGQSEMVPSQITYARPGDPAVEAGPAHPGGKEYVGPYFTIKGSDQGDISGNILDLQFLYQQLLGTPGSGLRQGQYFGPRGKAKSKGWKESALRKWLSTHSRLFKE